MTIFRSLAPLALAIAPLCLAHCTSTTDDGAGGGGGPSGGAGNATGGASGAGGSAAGSGGTAGVGGTGVTGGSAGATTTGGTGGAGGSSGAAGASTGGAGGMGGAASGAGGGGAGGGGAGGATSGAGGGGAGGAASGGGGAGGGGQFVLTSSKIIPDMEMSADFTCAGDAHSPPLAWSGVPAGTMSFAMVFVDTTILGTNPNDPRGFHSAIWDIPATTTALPEDLPVGATITTPVMAKQFNPLRAAYLGPCPNNGAAPADVYEFRLYALPVATLTGMLTSVQRIEQAITAANPLGRAVLRARSDATGTLM